MRAIGFVRVEPSYQLTLSAFDPEPGAAHWRLSAKLKVIPVRSEVREVIVELPPTWTRFEADPLDLVESVTEVDAKGVKRYTVRLFTAERAPFELALTAHLPAAAKEHEAAIPFPEFPRAVEQAARVEVRVPNGLTVRGTAVARDRGEFDERIDLTADRADTGAGSSADPKMAVTALSADFESGVGRVDLVWRLYQPDMPVRVDTEVTFYGSQARVEQAFQFGPVEEPNRPVRFRTLANSPPNLRFNPPLARDPIGGDLVFRPPSGAREYTLHASYSLRIPETADGTQVPIGLLWPEGVTRAESRVRVWGDAMASRVIGFDGPWGELPPEPDMAKDSLPWLTLAGSGTDLTLALKLAGGDSNPLPSVTVERGLFEARVGMGDEVAHMRARFRLREWPDAGVLVSRPVGVGMEVTADGILVTNLTSAATGIGAGGAPPGTILVPLPPSINRTLVLDIKYDTPATWTSREDTVLTPPVIADASYLSPVRWQVLFPEDVTPLYLDSGLTPENRWVRRGMLITPAGGATAAELDEWFESGKLPAEPDGVAAGESAGVTARQATPGAIQVYRVPWNGWVAGCSLLVLVVGLGVSRLPATLVGPAVGLIGAGAAVAAVAWPQPMSQLVGGCQPGLWSLVVVLAGQAGLRWYHRRRVMYLPGFTRTRPESVVGSQSYPAENENEKRSDGGGFVARPTGSGAVMPPAERSSVPLEGSARSRGSDVI